MSEQGLLFALQCCSPSNMNERDCANCPFSDSTECHTELCEELIAYIVREQGKTEAFARGIDSVMDAVNNLHALC